mgnify:FL=1|jgi:hypothetical protein
MGWGQRHEAMLIEDKKEKMNSIQSSSPGLSWGSKGASHAISFGILFVATPQVLSF